MRNKIASLGNIIDQMEERISDIKDRYLKLAQEEERGLRMKKINK